MKFNPNNFQEQVKPGIGYYPALAWIFLLCPLKDEIRLTSSTHDEMKMLFCGGENFGADRAINGMGGISTPGETLNRKYGGERIHILNKLNFRL